jgi:hypothetical protein
VDRSGQGVVMSEQRAFASLAWQAKGKVVVLPSNQATS